MIDSIDTLVSLGAYIATSEWARSTMSYRGARMLDEIVECIVDFPDQDGLYARKSSIEHGLFDIQFEDGYSNFMSRIGW